jgi:DNA-binding GntR family transcriptional regulator
MSRRAAAAATRPARGTTPRPAKAAPQVAPAKPEAAPLLADRAYAEIKQRINTLFYLPGQYLNQGAISGVLGIGRTPVHQALKRLEQEGLVGIVPRKGVIIQPNPIARILEVLEARWVVEGEIARQAAARATAADIVALERALKGSAAPRRAGHGGGAIDAFIESDRAFHCGVAALSGNPVLEDLVRSLHERSTRQWYLTLWQTLDHDRTGQQHRAVVAALRKGDGAAACRAMRAHLSDLRDRLQRLAAAEAALVARAR